MATITNYSEYRTMVDALKYHDYRYFRLNCPTITDDEYDTMYFAVQDYEQAHPQKILPDSSTQICFSENGNGKKTVARRTACLSMKKVHDAKAMAKYLCTQAKTAGLKNARIDVEWKLDGETVALVYRRGRLAEATYGHGKELMGNDCLLHIQHVRGVPTEVSAWERLNRVEVRGEVIINNDEFARYSGAGKSQRVTSNGIMSRICPVTDECKRLEFHPFRLIMDGMESHWEAMEQLSHEGFMESCALSEFVLTDDMDTVEEIIEGIVLKVEDVRSALPFPTDGLVFKFDDYTAYEKLGFTPHDAKYNCAFKFRPVHEAVTTYRGYHTTVGKKTGKVTYIANFDAVTMNGHTFCQANCGTERTFMAKDLHEGDCIRVSLHGDVIVCVDGKVDAALNNTMPEEAEYVAPMSDADTSDMEITPVMPQPRPERHYRMHRESSYTTPKPRVKRSMAKKIASVFASVVVVAGAGVLLFSLLGFGFFLVPLLGGAFAKG